MPFLRVIRDKRGYETTYLIHWYREGARQRSRILYIFRTPGGVRVGRDALDPDVLREIEARYPDIAFDWKAVIDTRQVIETTPTPRWPRKRRDGEDERPPAGEAAMPPHAGVGPGGDSPTPGFGAAGAAAAAPTRPPVPPAIQGSTSEEQIAFLVHWYPIVRDRIPQRTSDPARREALLALAERLNPAEWTDADELAAGLPRAAESLERLSRVLSRRRRKSRRTPARPARAVSSPTGVEPPAVSAVNPLAPSAVDARAPGTVEVLAASAVEPQTVGEEPAPEERASSGASTDAPVPGE